MELTVGEKIMIYRRRAGMSSKELGERSGINASTIRAYESEKQRPELMNILRISKVLNIRAKDLMDAEMKQLLRQVQKKEENG